MNIYSENLEHITSYGYFFVLAVGGIYSMFVRYMMQRKMEYLEWFLVITFIIDFSLKISYQFFDKIIKAPGFYLFLDLFWMLFFCFFYRNQFQEKPKIFFKLGIIFMIVGTLLHLFSTENYSSGISTSIFNIIISLILLFKLLNIRNTNISILKIPVFWIATALIFWNVFYIFRMIPRFLFQKMDAQFMSGIRVLFNIINIVFYSVIIYAISLYKNYTIKLQ